MQPDLEDADGERPQRVGDPAVLFDDRATQAALGGDDLEEVGDS
jgi:hypothetical protein